MIYRATGLVLSTFILGMLYFGTPMVLNLLFRNDLLSASAGKAYGGIPVENVGRLDEESLMLGEKFPGILSLKNFSPVLRQSSSAISLLSAKVVVVALSHPTPVYDGDF